MAEKTVIRATLYPLLLLSLLALAGCGEQGSTGKTLIEVGGSTLTAEMLPEGLTKGLAPNDSSRVIQEYLARWAKSTRAYEKARQSLTPQQVARIEAQVDEYRHLLAIATYEASYIAQHLDTVVTPAQADAFYRKYASELRLEEPYVRCWALEIPTRDEEILRRWRVMAARKSKNGIERMTKAVQEDQGVLALLQPDTWQSLAEVQRILSIELPARVARDRSPGVELTRDGKVIMLAFHQWAPVGDTLPPSVGQQVATKLAKQARIEGMRDSLRQALEDSLATPPNR